MTSKKFCIVLHEYIEEEPYFIGELVWTEEQAQDLVNLFDALMGITTNNHINDKRKSIYDK